MSDVTARRIATEVVVIVGSILLAFALDAWWDERQEEARVDQLLDAVAVEFEAEVVVLDSIIAINVDRLRMRSSLIEAADPSRPPISGDSLAALTADPRDMQIYDPGFGALNALITSGGIERIDDLDLQRRLAGWPAELTDLDWERGQAYDAVQSVLRRLAEIGFLDDVQAAGNFWPVLWRAMREDELYRQYETGTVFAYDFYTADLRRVRERASALAATIRAR